MPDKFQRAVAKFRDDGDIPFVRYGLIDRDAGAGDTIPVQFRDGTSWTIKTFREGKDKNHIIRMARYEAEILERLNHDEFFWAPRLIGKELTFDNPVRFPHIVYVSIPGHPLVWDHERPEAPCLRQHVTRQLARILVQLLEKTRRDGPLNESTFSKFVDRKYDKLLLDAWKLKIGGGINMARQCLIFRKLLSEDDRVGSVLNSTILCHNFLVASNIIIDETYNIIGIADWGAARYQPCQFAAVMPRAFWMENDDAHWRSWHNFMMILLYDTPIGQRHPDIANMIRDLETRAHGKLQLRLLQFTIATESFKEYVRRRGPVDGDIVKSEWNPLLQRQTLSQAGVKEQELRARGWL